MGSRLGRLLVTLVAGSFGLGGTAPAAAHAGGPPSEEFCGAFADFYAVRVLVALAESFSEFDDEESGGDGENVVAELYLVFSPKLERTTETMLTAAPEDLEKGLKRQLKVWRKGVALLQDDVGLDDEDIEAIADLDIEESSTDTEDVLGDVSDKKVKAAAKKFKKSVDSLEDDSTREEQQALSQAATDCGVVPDPDVDCETLVTDDEATAVLGGLSETETDPGCSWVGPEVDDSRGNSLAVEVYASGAAYERITERLAGTGEEAVPGLGEQATVLDGYSSQTLGRTCGRTLVAVVDDRTLQVALCLGDTPVTTEQLAALATQVAGRL